jgi:hypothetical protein
MAEVQQQDCRAIDSEMFGSLIGPAYFGARSVQETFSHNFSLYTIILMRKKHTGPAGIIQSNAVALIMDWLILQPV